MTKLKKRNLILAFLILLLISVSGGAIIPAAAASATVKANIAININEDPKSYTAKELLNAAGKGGDFTGSETVEITSFFAFDDLVAKGTYNGVSGKVTFEPVTVGDSKFKIQMTGSVSGEKIYEYTVYVVAYLSQDATYPRIEVQDIILEDSEMTVDFVNTILDNSDTGSRNIICLKNFLPLKSMKKNSSVPSGAATRNGIKIKSVQVTDGATQEGDSPSFRYTIHEEEDRKGFSFTLSSDHSEQVTLEVTLADMSSVAADVREAKVILILFRFANAADSPTVENVENLTQKINGNVPKRVMLSDLFKASTVPSGSTIVIKDFSKVEYNNKFISVEKITQGNDIVGFTVTPYVNGYDSINLSYTVKSAGGAESETRTMLVPVQVTGLFTMPKITVMNGVKKEFGAGGEAEDNPFKAIAAEGYIFRSASMENQSLIAEVSVKDGKLFVKPTRKGAGNIIVEMINPLAPDPDATAVSLSVPIQVKPFNLFEYLTMPGIITFFTLVGVVGAVIIVLVVLGLFRHKKNKRLKAQIMKAAEVKLQQKQEIQSRQRASMMMSQAMMASMMRPSVAPGYALNAGMGPRPTVLGINASRPMQPPKPILELNTASNNTGGFDEKTVKATGAAKADSFIEDIKQRAKREAEAQAEAKRAEEKRKKEELEQARRAAKIKQQQEMRAQAEQKAAEQAKAMEQERMVMQEKLDLERERSEKNKMRQEEDRIYSDTKRTEAISLNAALLDLYRQLASIDKLLFIKDIEQDKVNKDLALSADAKQKSTDPAEQEKLVLEMAEMAARQATLRSEIEELEQQAGADDERRSQEEFHVDGIVEECGFDDLKEDFARQRTELMREIESEYERFTRDYKNEFNTKEALEQAEKLRVDMIARTERTRRENLQKAIETKLKTIGEIFTEANAAADLTELAQCQGKLNGVIAALLPEERIADVTAAIHNAERAVSERREYLEANRRDNAVKKAKNLAQRMSDILRNQFAIDKALYLNNFNKMRADAGLKFQREKLSLCKTEQEVAGCNKEIEAIGDRLGLLNIELNKLESDANAGGTEGETLEGELETVLRDFGLDDLKKEIEYSSELLQRDLNNDYQKFVSQHKEDVQRQDAVEEAERVRKQMLEQAEKIRQEALRELVSNKLKTISDMTDEIQTAGSEERIDHYLANVNSLDSAMKDEERVPELLTALDTARKAADAKRSYLREEAKQQAEAKRLAAENAAKIKSAVDAKRRELLGIKGEIPTITDMSSANKLMNKLNQFADELPEELRVPEILVPVDKVHDAIVHAGEMAELRNTKVPQKKVVKKVVNTINKVKKPVPKKPGSASAKPGTKPGAKPGAKSAARPGIKSASARPGVKPAAKKAGVKPTARPGARPAAKAGAKTRPGARPAPKR